MSYGNIDNNSSDGTTTMHLGPQTLAGARTYIIPWIATARNLTDAGGVLFTKAEQAGRTATTCYMRGLKERIQIQTSSGVPWQWRRVCFTYRGQAIVAPNVGLSQYAPYQETTSGMMRSVTDWNRSSAAITPLLDIMFKGRQQTDWNSYFGAPLDSTRISIKYDKTRIIQSGNTSGVMRNVKLWHPMNHNLVYNDEEAADTETTADLSVSSKQGMGDYYVVDIIAGGTGSTSTDFFSFEPTASLYWHEK